MPVASWNDSHAAAVFVEEGCEHRQGRNLGEGIHESRGEAGNHIEVAVAGLDEGEKARSVHALTVCEDGVEILLGVDYKIQSLETVVVCRVHEIHHANLVRGDIVDDVGLGEILRVFLQKTYQRVGRELEIWCHGFIDLVFFKIIDRNAKAVYAPAP